jgi:hypothetical protein
MVNKDENPGAPQPRGQTRSSMFLAAVLRSGTEQAPVKVRNMSPNGALIETSVTPIAGSKIDLIRGSLIARGTVMWASTGRCGIRFTSEISVKDWLAPPNKAEQQRVDDMVAVVKSGGASPRDDRGEPSGPRSQEQLVDDLHSVLRLMHDLEDDLVHSHETLKRHAIKLQNLDIAMQMLRAVSAELMPNGDKGPTNLARLETLRIACTKALNMS